MKYFKELSKEDQERALTKLVSIKKLKFNCLLRVLAPKQETPLNKIVNVNLSLKNTKKVLEKCSASVVSFYYDNGVLKANVVFDHTPNVITKGLVVNDLEPCDYVAKDTRSRQEIEDAKKALEKLLTLGEHYVFDHKCNAYTI